MLYRIICIRRTNLGLEDELFLLERKPDRNGMDNVIF